MVSFVSVPSVVASQLLLSYAKSHMANRPSTFSYMIHKAGSMAKKSSPVSVKTFLAH